MSHPMDREVQQEVRTGGDSLRIFQAIAALIGLAFFVAGLVAVFDVDFGGGWLRTTGEVAGLGFSPVGAIAAIVLGAALLGATLADQDRGSAAIVAFLIMAVGIAGLILNDQPDTEASVDTDSATAFIVLGAIAFVCSLVPWWSGRRYRTRVR